MSDFDKIFRDRLNEEDDFPRMEQNWQKLSAKMGTANAPDAKSVPLKPHPQLVAWKWAVAATGLLLVSSNIWWWLHQNGQTTLVSSPTIEQKATDDIAPIAKTDTVYKIVYRDAELNKGENKGDLAKSGKVVEKTVEKTPPLTLPSSSRPSGTVSKSFLHKKQAEQLVSKQNLAGKTPVFNAPIEKNTPIAEAHKVGKKENTPLNSTSSPVENKAAKNEKTSMASSEKTEVKKDFPNEKKEVVSATVLSENDKKEVLKTPATSEKNEGGSATVLVENGKKEVLKTPSSSEKNESGSATVLSENTKNEPLKTGENVQNIEPKRNPESIGTEGGVKTTEAVSSVENTQKEGTEKPNNPATKQDNTNKIATAETPKEDKKTVESPEKKGKNAENTGKAIADNVIDTKQDMAAPAPPIVKPLKAKPIFSIGAYALVAFPAEKDLSALKAAGATLGIKINDHFRADISGFSGEMDYKVKMHKPHWHIPGDPRNKPIGGLPRETELREIRGRQVRQQVAMSLTYLFKSKGWLTPKVELGYAVQRIANQSAKFEFREPVTGREIHTTELSAPQTFKNLWNIGFGVEKSFGHFTGDITAAFQKDLSDKSVDMMVLRGGVRYSF
jgi:hypothetical protein